MCLLPHPEAWGCLCKVCPGEGVLKKTSDVPVALQRGKNDLFKAVFPEQIPREGSGGSDASALGWDQESVL